MKLRERSTDSAVSAGGVSRRHVAASVRTQRHGRGTSAGRTVGDADAILQSLLPIEPVAFDDLTLLFQDAPSPATSTQKPTEEPGRRSGAAVGATLLPDPVDTLAAPDRRAEPVLAAVLTLACGLVVWTTGAAVQACIPLLTIPFAGLLSIAAPGRAAMRMLRAIAVLIAAAAAAVLAPDLLPATSIVTVAVAAVYPAALLPPRAGRWLTGSAVVALATPIAAELLLRDLVTAWVEGARPSARDLAPNWDVVRDPVRMLVLATAAGGCAVVTQVGRAGSRARSDLTAAVATARQRGQDARAATAERDRVAATDISTGLPDREAFLRATALRSVDAQPIVVAVDIDRWDAVLDGFGAEGAEDAARQVAVRLAAVLSTDDLLSRTGPHRFAVLQEAGSELEEPSAFGAATARRLIAALHEPLMLDGHRVPLTCSIGIAGHPIEVVPGASHAAALLQAAEAAARTASRPGRSSWRRSDAELQNRLADRSLLERHLRDAVRRQHVPLAFRPVLELGISPADDRVCAVEAVATMPGSDLAGAELLALADEIGVGISTALHVIEQSLDALIAWRAVGADVGQVWVTLTPAQLDDPELAHMISARLAGRGMPASALLVQIDASAPVDGAGPRSTLGTLRSLGVAAALDGFGAAGTSLTSLRELPISMVKLDCRLVEDLALSGRLPMAVSQLCRTMHLRVVVQGVEGFAQLEAARGLGADAVIGPAVAGPADASEIAGLLAAQAPRAVATAALQ